MAKEVLKITNISGGINTYSSARDIDETQIVEGKNIDVSKPGLIRSSGVAQAPGTPADTTGAALSGAPVAGTGLYSYSSDYKTAEVTENVITGTGNADITNSGNWDVSNGNWTQLTTYIKFQSASGSVTDQEAFLDISEADGVDAAIIADKEYMVVIFAANNTTDGAKVRIRGGSGKFFTADSTEYIDSGTGWYTFYMTSNSSPSDDKIYLAGTATGTTGYVAIYQVKVYLKTTAESTNYKLIYDNGDDGINTFANGATNWLDASKDYNGNLFKFSSATNGKPVYTSIDGNVRVSDANFDNTNIPLWRGYINKPLFGVWVVGGEGTYPPDGSKYTNYLLPGFYNYSTKISAPVAVSEAYTFETDGTAPAMNSGTGNEYLGMSIEYTAASDVDMLIGQAPMSSSNGPTSNTDYSTSGANGGTGVSTAQGCPVTYGRTSNINGTGSGLGENYADATAGVANHSTDNGYFLYFKDTNSSGSGGGSYVNSTQFAFKTGTFKINWAAEDSFNFEIKGFGQASNSWSNSFNSSSSHPLYAWITIWPPGRALTAHLDHHQGSGFGSIFFRSESSIPDSWSNDGNWHTVTFKSYYYSTGGSSPTVIQQYPKNNGVDNSGNQFVSTSHSHYKAGIFGRGDGFGLFFGDGNMCGGSSPFVKNHDVGDAAYVGMRNFYIARAGGAGSSIGTFYFWYSWLYDDDKIESPLRKINDTGLMLWQESNFKFKTYIRRELSTNRRITGARLYFQKNQEDEKYFMQEIDFIKGTKTLGEEEYLSLSPANTGETAITYQSQDWHNWHGTNGVEWTNKIITYKSNIGTSDEFLDIRWKTAIVINRRMYIGNIGVRDSSGKIIKRMGDRMMKSVVNKFDSFPENNFIDVAVNDGEEITHLAHFADRILQFKSNDLYIINIAGDSEFLENQFKHVGVKNSCQVTSTEIGVIWVNNKGLFIYDGNQVHNLIDGRIDEGDFLTEAEEDKSPCIGYDAVSKKIIISRQSEGSGSGTNVDGWVFCTKSFSLIKLVGQFNNSSTTTLTNFITTNDGKIMYGNLNTFFTWRDTPTNDLNNTGGNDKVYEFITKDYDFEEPSVRKKISKIYVTYKTKSGSDSAVYLRYAVDGSGDFSNFTDLTGVSNYDSSGSANGFSNSGALDNKVAEIKPAASLTVKSLQLKFSLETVAQSGAEEFQIEDISIVYRKKTVR